MRTAYQRNHGGDEEGYSQEGGGGGEKVGRGEDYRISVDRHQGGIGGGKLYPAEMLLAENQKGAECHPSKSAKHNYKPSLCCKNPVYKTACSTQ